MLVYPRFTALDLVGPQLIFAGLGNTTVHLVWKDREIITTDTGIPIQPTTTFADCPDDLAILCVPGGGSGTVALLDDEVVLDFLRRKAATAGLITSVCTGSLVLGAAGLLRGYRATSHWVTRDLLPRFGAIPVAERVVEDRNRITGAGVTAGIDFGLRIAARLRGDAYAQAIQLNAEYDPQPPFSAGNPDRAPAEVTGLVRGLYTTLLGNAAAAADRAAARFPPG